MSEPITHFLAHARLAAVQLGFWGNPITSGSANMDYFVSGDSLEHPFRTRMSPRDDPYTEQVVLLEGQGIWYRAPVSALEDVRRSGWELLSARSDFAMQLASAEQLQRSELGIRDEWFVFLCPQNVFKMHPLFDAILVSVSGLLLFRQPWIFCFSIC